VVETALSEQRRRSKLIVIWLVLGVLAVAIGYLKYSDWKEDQSTQATMAADERSLLPLKLEAISAVEVAYDGNLYRFERDQAGTWFYHAHGVNTGIQAQHGHVADPAQAEEIQTRLGGLGRARMERKLDPNNKEEYGVTRPQMLILVYIVESAKPLAQYAVGDLAPDKLSRYVMLVDTGDVVTIANYQIQNLIDLIAAVTTAPADTVQKQSQ
jgi:hypothetical protein